MAKKKLIHFQENLTFPHLFQPHYHEIQSGFHLKSNWNDKFFMNQNPIIVELGCGKGEYTVGLAERHPEKNFIGIDIKGARLWRGCKSVDELGLKNTAFVRTRVDFLTKLFGPHEISEIWITFPDPQPGKERKRLTAPVFLNIYKMILIKDGIIHLKTDNQFFFDYTFQVINEWEHRLLYITHDLYNSGSNEDAEKIQTYYENIWLKEGKSIYYLKFSLNTDI